MLSESIASCAWPSDRRTYFHEVWRKTPATIHEMERRTSEERVKIAITWQTRGDEAAQARAPKIRSVIYPCRAAKSARV